MHDQELSARMFTVCDLKFRCAEIVRILDAFEYSLKWSRTERAGSFLRAFLHRFENSGLIIHDLAKSLDGTPSPRFRWSLWNPCVVGPGLTQAIGCNSTGLKVIANSLLRGHLRLPISRLLRVRFRPSKRIHHL